MECKECLNEDAYKRKNDRSCTLWVGTIKLLPVPVPNCLTLCMSLMDSILILYGLLHNDYQCNKADFSGGNYLLCCYVCIKTLSSCIF